MKNSYINKFVVYTVVTGKEHLYDKIHQQNNKFKESTIDYYLFTNNDAVKSDFFKVVYIESPIMSSKILSREIKIKVQKYLPDYEISLYLDGNVIIKNFLSPLFINMKADIETFHLHRNIIKEAEWIKKRKYCTSEILSNKLQKYKKDGFDLENSKIKYGKIILRKNLKIIKDFSELWFNEYKDISRDQLSLPYCIWKFNIQHRSLGGGRHCKSFKRYFKWVNHNKKGLKNAKL